MDSVNSYQLPNELTALRDQVGRIIREEIIPIEARIDPDAAEIPEDDYWRLARKVQAAGMWCMAAPREYGGGGLSTLAMTVSRGMCHHHSASTTPGQSVWRTPPPLSGRALRHRRNSTPVEPSERVAYVLCITEPSVVRPRSHQCRAVRQGDSYVLNGTKIFISHAHEAEWGVVFARTDPKAGRQGVTCFIIKKGQSGFTARPIRTIRTSAIPNEVAFEDCVVPIEQRVGEEGQGLNLCLDLLTRLRFPYSAANVGVGVAALRMAIEHAKRRSTFGELLSRRQAIQWMLADSEVELRAARWLAWEGAWKADRGEDFRTEASIAKLYSSEALGRVIDRAVQIHGGYGVSKELPLERWYREARVRRIGEGPSEVHRMVIARTLLR